MEYRKRGLNDGDIAAGFQRGDGFVSATISIGNSNEYLLILQGQVGWYYFFSQMFGWGDKGLYAGASLRYMDIVNLNSRGALLPLLSLGYWLDFGGVLSRTSQA